MSLGDSIQEDFKSGFIALIGRPNVGKSTFINKFIGEKIAITSPIAQTTRTVSYTHLTLPTNREV